MGFFKNLFRKKNKEIEPESLSQMSLMEASGPFDEDERHKYIDECILQMREASDEIDLLNREYDSVTSHLNDMDEIERLPEHIMGPIMDCARKINKMENERVKFSTTEGRMKDSDFARMERIADEMPEGYEKLKEAEEFQQKIHSDLRYIDNEKQAYAYRKNELNTYLSNIKGIIIISIVAMVLCFIMLFVLHYAFELDVRLGYIIATAAIATVFFIVFFKNSDYSKELRKVEKTNNKLVLIHNATKIRYVNNTNLLEYFYLKYGVDSSRELSELWQQYLKEKTDREKYEQTLNDIPLYKEELIRRLSRCPISDPNIWVRQTEALINKKEMVEIRHALIERRQNLRKQMDENREYGKDALDRIKHFVRIYPQYSAEIMRRVEDIEKQ